MIRFPRHMDNGTEVGSEINLTIEKTSANTLTISASSTDANDPIDLLLLGAQDVVGQVNPMTRRWCRFAELVLAGWCA